MIDWSLRGMHWIGEHTVGEVRTGTYRTTELEGGSAKLDYFLEGRALKPPQEFGAFENVEVAKAAAPD